MSTPSPQVGSAVSGRGRRFTVVSVTSEHAVLHEEGTPSIGIEYQRYVPLRDLNYVESKSRTLLNGTEVITHYFKIRRGA